MNLFVLSIYLLILMRNKITKPDVAGNVILYLAAELKPQNWHEYWELNRVNDYKSIDKLLNSCFIGK